MIFQGQSVAGQGAKGCLIQQGWAELLEYPLAALRGPRQADSLEQQICGAAGSSAAAICPLSLGSLCLRLELSLLRGTKGVAGWQLRAVIP